MRVVCVTTLSRHKSGRGSVAAPPGPTPRLTGVEMPVDRRPGTPYESLPKHPGIQRVHRNGCAYVAGKRCTCSPGYRAEAFDRSTRRRRYKTFASLEAARTWRADTQTLIRGGRLRLSERVTVAQAWGELAADIESGVAVAASGEPYKPAVVRAYASKFKNYLLPRFGPMALQDVRLSHVQAFVDDLTRAGQAPRTTRNAVMPLRVLYRWAIRRELASVNPCDGVQFRAGERARDRIVDTREALALLQALEGAVRPWEVAVYATALFAGLRRGELMALRCEDVDLEARTLRVERSYDPGARAFVSPKSKKGRRTVGIPKLLVPYLAAVQLASGRREGLVFGVSGATPFNDAHVRERARAAWEAAGLEGVGLHEARHCYASHLISAGVNVKTVSEYMGHASVQITWDRYGKLIPSEQQTVLAQIDAYHERAASS
jgi:integrase